MPPSPQMRMFNDSSEFLIWQTLILVDFPGIFPHARSLQLI